MTCSPITSEPVRYLFTIPLPFELESVKLYILEKAEGPELEFEWIQRKILVGFKGA